MLLIPTAHSKWLQQTNLPAGINIPNRRNDGVDTDLGVPCHAHWLTLKRLVLICIQGDITFYKWKLSRQFTTLWPALVGNMPLAPVLPPKQLSCSRKWLYGAWLSPGVGEGTLFLSLTKHFLPIQSQQLQPGGAGPITEITEKLWMWLLLGIQGSNCNIKIYIRSI